MAPDGFQHISVLFYLTNRYLIGFSVECLKESLLVAFVVLGTYFLVKAVIESDVLNLAVSFILFSLGFFVRGAVAVVIAAGFTVWMLYSRNRGRAKILFLIVFHDIFYRLVYIYDEAGNDVEKLQL